jgi:hypothetical protein
MKNDSDVGWRDIQYEVEFHDATGKMVDTMQGGRYSCMVLAHQTQPFKVSFERQFPKESYASFKIKVITAKDEKSPY